MKRVYPIEEYCIACHLCEVACIVEHSKTKNLFTAFKEEPKINSKIEVQMNGPLSFSANCRHCIHAECIEACPVGAMVRNEKGAVVVDAERCIGCWMCVMACPQGSVTPRVDNGKEMRISDKCDLCPDKETPACVEACPNEALVFEDRNEEGISPVVPFSHLPSYEDGEDMNILD